MSRALRMLAPAAMPEGGVRVFRVSPVGPATATVLVGVWMLACAAVAWTGGLAEVNIPPALAGWAAFWIGLYWLYVLNDLRKALKPAAWLAALGPDGVYLNCRSYRNAGRGAPMAHAAQVVLIPYASIAAARAGVQSADAAGEPLRVVELRLAGADPSALEQCLAAARDGLAAGGPLGRMLWWPSPVALHLDAVRVDFHARRASRVLLFELSRRGVPVESPPRPVPLGR